MRTYTYVAPKIICEALVSTWFYKCKWRPSLFYGLSSRKWSCFFLKNKVLGFCSNIWSFIQRRVNNDICTENSIESGIRTFKVTIFRKNVSNLRWESTYLYTYVLTRLARQYFQPRNEIHDKWRRSNYFSNHEVANSRKDDEVHTIFSN